MPGASVYEAFRDVGFCSSVNADDGFESHLLEGIDYSIADSDFIDVYGFDLVPRCLARFWMNLGVFVRHFVFGVLDDFV